MSLLGGAATTGFEVVVVGGSAGALSALKAILAPLPPEFRLPVVLVLHRLESGGNGLVSVLRQYTALPVCEIEDKSTLCAGRIHLAPAGYHVLLEEQGHFGLSVDVRVSYSRPSIDVLLDSVADVCGASAVAVVLTGANCDGAAGLKRIREAGGMTIAQDPASAVVPYMPLAAIDAGAVQKVMDPRSIGIFLAAFGSKNDNRRARHAH